MKNKHREPHILQWVLVLVFFGLSTYLVGQNASYFQTTVIPTKQAAPYDGTVLPIQKAPNWVALSSDQYKVDYDQLPSDKLLPLPTYDPAQLKTSTETLGWKTETDKAIRNAKITFSTPYMGNYKLDGVEYAGSHLAVDIKVPNNTPVYAIGNGVVIKVSTQSTGFGVHIVVKHENFPSFDNPNSKTTYYSSYSHLNSALISEGEVVTKGQEIGITGQTGTASTPHLHFQIDNDQAPWHPYWPFTYQEAQNAGYSFSDAVNYGLGKDKALSTTVNPMLYVQKYLNGTVTDTSSTTLDNSTSSTDSATLPPKIGESSTSDSTSDSTSTASDSTDNSSTDTTVDNTVTENPATAFKVITDGVFVVGNEEEIQIQAVDNEGSVAISYKPKDGVSLMIENGGASIANDYLRSDDFVNGIATAKITPTAPQGLRLKASDGNISGLSDIMQSEIFSDVPADNEAYEAISFLKTHEVLGGYPDGSFKPQNVVSRVEALKFIVKGVNLKTQTVQSLPFKDTVSTEWYANYVATAYNEKIVSGYPDLTFKPAQTVNRAEFLKMLLTAMKVDLPQTVQKDLFDDVPADAWYAPYVQYAKDKNLIDTSSNMLKPEEGMTREEVAEVIYRMLMVRLTGQNQYQSGLAVSSLKVEEYFAG